MQQDGRDDKVVADTPSMGAPVADARGTLRSRWPWGLTAVAVIVAGWVGIYLLWNGVAFLLGG